MEGNLQRRHIAKTITWRIVGTVDTMLLAWIISGDPYMGLQVGLAEVLTKMVLYYFHERLWYNSKFGNTIFSSNSRRRHLAKTFSWRIIGTFDTMILAWVITGNPLTGLKIGLAEVITKMFLYYLHERTWYRFDYGLEKRRREKE